MPLWNIFGNKKKQEQKKRARVRMLAQRAGFNLSDEQMDLLDMAAITAILSEGVFGAEHAAMVGVGEQAGTREFEQQSFDDTSSSGYNETPRDVAEEIAETTVSEDFSYETTPSKVETASVNSTSESSFFTDSSSSDSSSSDSSSFD